MIELSYVSLFSGIEAFSIAASRVEGVRWNPVFFSEIDPFPCAVLAHHFPQVPNLGDICKIRVDREKGLVSNDNGTTVTLPRHGIDILAGGSPCQDLSVAGLRKGAERGSGTRSALFFEYARLVEELHPRILLFENVPGMLSSNQGRDFYYMQSALVDCGYSLAWRILDAQYTVVDGFPRAVPQRRKRVWLVGCLGADESVPAQILFERPGLLGDTPPRREAGQGFACPPGYCATGDDRVVGGAGCRAFVPYGTRLGASPEGIIQPLTHIDSKFPQCVALRTDTIGGGGHDDVSEILTARSFKGIGARNGQISGPFVAVDVAPALDTECGFGKQTLQSVGHLQIMPVQDDNAGQNQQAVLCATNSNGEDVSATLDAKGNSTSGIGAQNDKRGGYILATFENHAQDSRVKETEVMPTMGHSEANSPGSTGNNPLVCAVKTANTASPGGEGAVCVGFKAGQSANGGLGEEAEVSPTMSHKPSALEPTVATMLKVRCGKDTYTKPDGSVGTAGKGPLASEESAFTLAATQDQSLVLRHIVRRLTPIECERLMALPDNYTRIPYRGKPADQCPDSPRYKALGNSWATNRAEWILRRIVAAVRLGMIGDNQ